MATKTPDLYIVLKRIRYHNENHPLNGQLIEPGSEEAQQGLPMDHLDEGPLNILVRKRYLQLKPAEAPAKK